ncbi:MAG: Crp/Fnr family transcriptional regulator [Paludibacteraceae bacterium]|nr:Crp/Fnr family transcriptional regulator [Paludibacteraceae bacterium]
MAGKSSQEPPLRQLWEMNSVWEALTYEEKEFVNRNVEICHYKKNDIIHHEGDYPTHVMMLGSGKLRVYKEGVGQKPQIIRMLKPNDFFAYRAMIADENYNTNVSAFENSVVYKVRRDIFMQLIQQNPRFCYLFMIVMAKDLGRSDEKVVNLTQKHIRGRLADALLTLKQNYGLDEDGATISMYMSREDLANLSNMTTANAIRTLSQFAQEGVISIDGRKIKILDEPALAKISRVG